MKAKVTWLALAAAALIGSDARAQFTDNSQTNIVSGVTNDWPDDYYVGSNYVFNALLIQDSGVLSNGLGVIGYTAGANSNYALVSGLGSVWSSRSDLRVGHVGACNQLVITNRAVVFNEHCAVGVDSNSINNSVVVTGSGSVWNNHLNLFVGSQGPSNRLLIANHGAVFNDYGVMGSNPNSTNNSVVVTGSGAAWSNRLNLYVGGGGAGSTLVVSNQGRVFNNLGFIGFYPGSSNNSVTVTGPNSVWSNNFLLHIGESGSGNSLVIANQGKVYNDEGDMGWVSSGNRVLLTGSGSVWSNRGNLFVGVYGPDNSVTVSNQGKLYNNYGTVGYSSSSNSVVVSGSGSIWSNAVNMTVGRLSPANTLLITNGGTVVNNQAVVSYDANSYSNSVVVTGSNSTWLNLSGLYLGGFDTGNSLLIRNQGKVFNEDGYVGYYPGSSNNSVVVVGAGSTWSNRNNLLVGENGSYNALVISNQGKVFNNLGTVGDRSSNNTVLVTGFGSVWSNRAGVTVGGVGSENQLVIDNQGAVLSAADGILGLDSDSRSNTAVVTGQFSIWKQSGLYVGWNGSANHLVISNRGSVVNNFGSSLAVWPTSSNNTVEVTGPGSALRNVFDLKVGERGSGNTLLISSQGSVANNDGYVGFDVASSNNCVRVADNGRWRNFSRLYFGAGGCGNVLNIAGGSVVASNLFISAWGIASNNVIRVDSGSLVVTNAAGDGALVVSSADGSGTLIVNGGTVTADRLLVTNGFNSIVAFNAGTIHCKGTAATNSQPFIVGDGTATATYLLLGGVHSFNDGLRISSNSYLTGCGTINGDVVVDAGGTVLANCGSNLRFTGNVTNNGVMIAYNGSVLESSGMLVNNGKILRLNGGATDFHGTFIDSGGVVSADPVRISNISRAENDVLIQIPSLAGCAYRLQFTPSLQVPTWSDAGTAQIGNGDALTFIDPGVVTNGLPRFYRVRLQ